MWILIKFLPNFYLFLISYSKYSFNLIEILWIQSLVSKTHLNCLTTQPFNCFDCKSCESLRGLSQSQIGWQFSDSELMPNVWPKVWLFVAIINAKNFLLQNMLYVLRKSSVNSPLNRKKWFDWSLQHFLAIARKRSFEKNILQFYLHKNFEKLQKILFQIKKNKILFHWFSRFERNTEFKKKLLFSSKNILSINQNIILV